MNLNTLLTIKWYILSFLTTLIFVQNINGQCVPTCNNQVNISLDNTGQAIIDPFTVLQGDLNSTCLNSLSELNIEIAGVTYTQSSYMGISITSANLTCTFIGESISYTLEYVFVDGSKNSCWGSILLEDKLEPILSCSDLEIKCNDPQSPAQLSQIYSNAQPVINDNCNNATLNHSDVYEDFGCANPNYFGKIIRTWTAIDNSNNSSTCIQNIFIKKITANNISFPQNLDDISLTSLECPNQDISPSITGVPLLNGQPISNEGSCQLLTSHEDQTFPVCGNSYKILRTWIVMDNCNNEMYNHQQIIKVLDQTAPNISCSETLTVSTNSSGCNGSIFIPEATIIDACSNFIVTTETPNGILDGNGGIVSNLPLGTHTITYLVIDDCGNTSSCSTTLTINDNVAPIVICDEHTKVSLTSDGVATIDASVFDDGSYDNCEIIDYKVRRMATTCSPQSEFADQVSFDCCDINSGYILVEFQVIDIAGNTNSCMVEVDVEDKLDPIIVCPTNKTIECTQNLYNFGLLGQPIVSDNCPGVTIQRVDNSNLNDCGIGTVERIWTAVDVHGRTSSCVQLITIINSYPFDENDIIYPFDLTTSECGITALSPDELDHPYAKPTFNQDACDQITSNYEDTYLPIAAPACFKILRKWTVIDWCQFNPNAIPNANGSVSGKWIHTQTIKVIDYSPPVFTTCSNDLIFENFESNCGNTYVELITQAEDCSPDLNYTYEIDLNNNGVVDHTGNSNNASGSYPNGNHKISFTVEDGCGNLGFCSFFFQIKDAKKPTPICINGLSSNLDANGSLTIWASDFEAGSSFDNCTVYENLSFSFSNDINQTSLIFDCSDLGEQPINLWVTDASGNQDYCTTFIEIQDNFGSCPSTPLASISGNIQTENGIHLENTTIYLQENPSQSNLTSSEGFYSFDELPQGFSYTVVPEKTNNPLNGVTTLDLVILHKHILGLDQIESPYQLIAADVNKSKSITTMDIVQLRRLILNLDTEFQNNTSWRFVDADYVFTNNANFLNEDFPEIKLIENLNENTNANFIAIKIGDLNGSASPNNFTSGDTREKTGNIFFQIKNKNFQKGEQVEIAFTSNEFKNIIGYQFTIEFDKRFLILENINSDLANSDENNFNTLKASQGFITTSWHQTSGNSKDEAKAFSLIFRALEDGEIINNISINSSKTNAEAYYSNNEILDVNLLFENTTTQLQNKNIQLFQNKPNPVTNQTTIGFNILNNENVKLEITDINGRLVKKVTGFYPKGYNEIIFHKKDLSTSGILYYSLAINGKRLTKTMMITE